jgi:hypothetical protein
MKTVKSKQYLGDVMGVVRMGVLDMVLDCQKAAGNFPFKWQQKAQAFVKASEDLVQVYEDLGLVMTGLHNSRELQNTVIEVELRRPHGTRPLPKWARAANFAGILRTAVGAWPTDVQMQELLVQCAYGLESITFPTLADHDWPKRSPLKHPGTRVDGSLPAPTRAS